MNNRTIHSKLLGIIRLIEYLGRYPSKILWIKPAKIIPSKLLGISVVFWAFPALDGMGCTFHFLDVPGSKPSPQYIFLIHPQEITFYRNILFIILSLIPNNSQQSHQYLSYWHPILLLPSLPNLSTNNFLTLFQPTHSTTRYTFPWQKYPKIHSYTLSYIHP